MVTKICTKILTKARWASKFSISGHMLGHHWSQKNPLNTALVPNRLQSLHYYNHKQ